MFLSLLVLINLQEVASAAHQDPFWGVSMDHQPIMVGLEHEKKPEDDFSFSKQDNTILNFEIKPSVHKHIEPNILNSESSMFEDSEAVLLVISETLALDNLIFSTSSVLESPDAPVDSTIQSMSQPFLQNLFAMLITNLSANSIYQKVLANAYERFYLVKWRL